MSRRRTARWLSTLLALALALAVPTISGTPAAAAGGMTVDQFVSTYNGRYVDVDGYPVEQPYQCTDLFNRYHMDVMGGSYVRMDISGGAKDLWSTSNSQVAALYTKVAASQPAAKGDVAVWSGSFPGSAGFGHVAIVLADKGGALSTLTQNPGATRIGDLSKGHLLGYLRPKTLPGGGGGVADGSYVSYQGHVYRIAGGAPIYVSSWTHMGGAQPVTALSDAQFASLRQYPADGTLIAGVAPGHPESGTVYRVAGGAPIYVSNYAHIGGDSGTIAVDLAAIHNAGGGTPWSHLRWQPADGTFVHDSDGSVYRFAGGAPVYVSNFDNVGGTNGQPVTRVDKVALEQSQPNGLWSHVRHTPADGTFVSDQDGSVYRFAGGAPIYVSNFDHVGGTGGQPVTRVDKVALERTASSGAWSHVLLQPRDGTFVSDQSGYVYRFAGGAPIYVSNFAHVGGTGGQPVTRVDQVALRRYESTGAWSHVRRHPADGTVVTGNLPGDPEHGGSYVFAGGAPIRVSSWANIGGPRPTTVVDLVAIRNGGGAERWSHIRYHPVDGTVLDSGAATYEVRGGAPYPTSTAANGVRVDAEAIRNAGGAGWWSHLKAVPSLPAPAPAPAPAPPSSGPSTGSLHLAVRAVSRRSKLRIDVGPDSAASNYRWEVQRRVGRKWDTVKRGKTSGTRDTSVVDMRRGRYRVVVPSHGGLAGATATARLRR